MQILTGLMLIGAVYAGEGAHEGNHPCAQIVKACKAAGFEKGKHKEGKGLFMDCAHPIVEGKAVNGVTVGADLVAECKAKKETWREKHHKD